MVKRKLKKPIIYTLYGLAAAVLLSGIYAFEKSLTNDVFKPDDDHSYVSDTILDNEVPVVNVDKIIMRPYHDQEIKVVKGFYDYKAEAEEQEKSLIYYENTYLQNTGVSYGGKENFEVVTILDGTVIEVKEDNILGKIVEIKHSDNIISVYQSLSEIIVKKDDVIKQGAVIGKSGTSNISKELNNHLYFELIYKGQNVNPEEYFDKNLKDL